MGHPIEQMGLTSFCSRPGHESASEQMSFSERDSDADLAERHAAAIAAASARPMGLVERMDSANYQPRPPAMTERQDSAQNLQVQSLSLRLQRLVPSFKRGSESGCRAARYRLFSSDACLKGFTGDLPSRDRSCRNCQCR